MQYRLSLSMMTDKEGPYGHVHANMSQWDDDQLVGVASLYIGQMTVSGEVKESNLLQWAIVNLANAYDVAAHNITKRFTDNEEITMLDMREPKLF
jgi:hypothetical protein